MDDIGKRSIKRTLLLLFPGRQPRNRTPPTTDFRIVMYKLAARQRTLTFVHLQSHLICISIGIKKVHAMLSLTDPQEAQTLVLLQQQPQPQPRQVDRRHTPQPVVVVRPGPLLEVGCQVPEKSHFSVTEHAQRTYSQFSGSFP